MSEEDNILPKSPKRLPNPSASKEARERRERERESEAHGSPLAFLFFLASRRLRGARG
jgi:hypothetical protein